MFILVNESDVSEEKGKLVHILVGPAKDGMYYGINVFEKQFGVDPSIFSRALREMANWIDENK